MRVEVRSDGELRVAEALGNDFEIHPCGQGQTRAGMAKVVQSCRTRRPKWARVWGPSKGTDMSLRSIRRGCEAVLADVRVPNPFDINDLCQLLSQGSVHWMGVEQRTSTSAQARTRAK